jgi:hypothetical protein
MCFLQNVHEKLCLDSDGSQRPCYLSRVDLHRNIRSRKQRTDIRKHGGKLRWGSEGYVGVVKWNEGEVIVKCECNSSRQYVLNYCYSLVYNTLHYLLIVRTVFISYNNNNNNVPDFGSVFLLVKYTDITQNTYVQSLTVTEIMAREKCGILAGLCTIGISWRLISVYPWVWCHIGWHYQ